MKKIIVLCLLLSAFVSCKMPQSDSWYSLKNGELECTLKGNATTGYLWQCTVTDISVAECVKDEYIPSSKESRIVGAGGEWKFNIKTKSSGTTEVVFEYARPWENEPIEKRTLKIECSSGKIRSVTEI